MKKIILASGVSALVDKDDYEKINSFRWHLHMDGYAINKRNVEGKQIETLMHRMLLCPKKGEIIDHINGNRLDNRKENLRLVNRFQHRWNSGKRSDNASGYVGVHFFNGGFRPRPWVAQITYKKKKISLGYFKTPEEASEVYQKKAEELFGEYRRI